MSDPKIAIIEWEDASDDENTWVDRADAAAPAVVVHRQVGWVLETTKTHVLLTSTISEKLLASRTRIPRGMVRKITYLTKGR